MQSTRASRLISLALAPWLLAQMACNRLVPPRPAVAWDPSPSALIVRASNCCGFVPYLFFENYIPEAQVWGDGRIIWVQTDGGSPREVLQAQLTPAETTDLLQSFVDEGFFGWNDNYGDYSVTDLPNTCLQVNLSGSSKSVCEYYRGAPAAFGKLYANLADGAVGAGSEYVPTRGYLKAYPAEPEQDQASAAPRWPAEALGFSLSEAEGGRWVEGEAAAFAWRTINANSWNNWVQDGEAGYQLGLIVPGVSMTEPPAE